MITVLTSFPMPAGTTSAAFAEKMAGTIERYQAVAGLRQKSYVFDAAACRGGGVYLFDSANAAKTCFDQALMDRATALFGEFRVQFLETPVFLDNMARTVSRSA